jgi:beta-glucuronidase
MLKKISSLAGMSPWVLMDFHSPRRLLPGTQDYYNRKGLISNTGQHKQAFYVLQKFYRRWTLENESQDQASLVGEGHGFSRAPQTASKRL